MAPNFTPRDPRSALSSTDIPEIPDVERCIRAGRLMISSPDDICLSKFKSSSSMSITC